MNILLAILIVVLVVVVLTLIYVVVQLNKYIAGLEDTVESYTDRVDNLQEALQRSLKENLFRDGSLKKQLVSIDDVS